MDEDENLEVEEFKEASQFPYVLAHFPQINKVETYG